MSSMSARRHSIWKSSWRSLIASIGTTKMKCVSSFADRGYSTPTPYISRYFDTTTGSKTDSHSYQEITKILQRLPSEIVFIADVTTELDGARAAGVATLLCVRPGNRLQPASTHRQIRTLDEVFPSDTGTKSFPD